MRSFYINVFCLVFIKISKSGGKGSKNNIKWGKKGVLTPKILKKTKKVDILKQMCYSLAKLEVPTRPESFFGWKVNNITNCREYWKHEKADKCAPAGWSVSSKTERKYMQKIIDNMRGPLTCLVVFALMVMTPFTDPQIALASDYVEDMQWSPMETETLESNSREWYLESSEVNKSLEGQSLAITKGTDIPMEEEVSVAAEIPAMDLAAETPAVEAEAPVEEVEIRQRKNIALPQWRIKITNEQLDLLERCVMAEGGGESYQCQVAIACVIINRVLSDKYPNNVEAVIKQNGQFSTWPTMIENTTATNEVKQAVREALTSEVIPEDVLYFRAGRYHKWASRYCRIDNTYFSTPK